MKQSKQYKPKILPLRQFGDPILRQTGKILNQKDMLSKLVQELIADMLHTNRTKDYGVGIAAPQVGENTAVALIDCKPSKTRPEAPTRKIVVINPTYEGIGKRSAKWEGCLSSGTGKNTLFAKALRFSKIKASWYDEKARHHVEELDGMIAHIFQHETDHVNGILFVDNVRDTRTYMLASEYRKRIVNK